MKIRVEVDENISEDEVVIRCKSLNDEVINIQKTLNDTLLHKDSIIFYQDDKEFYFDIDNILFFETIENGIEAHTRDDCFKVKYKLYELCEILPRSFMRISKSTILNVNHIYSITKNITGASLVEFNNTHKKVYVSRNYYKPLKLKLEEKRR